MIKTFIWLLSFILYGFILSGVYYINSIHCFESSYIEKLTFGPEMIYECKLRIKVPYSDPSYLLMNQVVQRSNRVINVLELFGQSPLSGAKNLSWNVIWNKLTSDQKPQFKVDVTIDEKNPLTFNMSQRHLTIGRQLFDSKGHFERGLIKIWLSQYLKNESILTSSDQFQKLLFESIVDLFYYGIFGHFNLSDSISEVYLSSSKNYNYLKWPLVIKNEQDYCDSIWKISEDYYSCATDFNQDVDSGVNLENKRKKLITMSLRPLLTTSLIQAFGRLTYKEQSAFLYDLLNLVIKASNSSERKINLLLIYENPLKEGIQLIRYFVEQFNFENKLTSLAYKKFYTYLNQQLIVNGINDTFAVLDLDYLFEFSDEIDLSSPIFKSIEKAFASHSQLRIAIRDTQKIWILPSHTQLPIKAFEKITVKKQIYFVCPILQKMDMNLIAPFSERLIMIKGCHKDSSFDFAMMFKFGPMEFYKKEQSLEFIQMYLPAFKLVQHNFNQVVNYFDLVIHLDLNQDELKALGWFQLQLDPKTHVYRPKSSSDAIEYFRVDAPH